MSFTDHDGIDWRDPRSALEESEEEQLGAEAEEIARKAAAHARAEAIREANSALARLLVFITSGPRLSNVGLRALVVARKIRPESIGGLSLEEIARQAGYGRSAAHKLSKEFEAVFGDFRGIGDRSDTARAHYASAWRAKHNSPQPEKQKGKRK